MSIDWWTLGFQTVNVAVLIWLLGHFFWKPVAAMIEARQAAADKVTGEAEAARAKADAALADVEKTRAGFAKEREAILSDAHQAAEAARTKTLAEAQTAAEATEAAAKAAIAKDDQVLQKAWAARSADLAVDIAGRLSARMDSKAVQANFLDDLLREIRDLPEAARKAVRAEDVTLELRSAVKIDAAARKSCGISIGEAFGGAPKLTFKTDHKLIAGFELHGEHLVVSSSWRADLAAIKADLAT
ncbi:MAG: ATPase [Sphingomonas sp. 28-66-16]|nr:MAG: ATPase [Sphingomonas sp. 28-66-16]